MTRRNGLFRVKIEFEDTPIMDEKVRGDAGLERVWKNLRRKF